MARARLSCQAGNRTGVSSGNRAELVHLLGYACLGRMDLPVCLSVKRLQFLLVGFRLACANIALQGGRAADCRLFLRLDEELQVGLSVRIVADFGQQKGIDVSAGGDEIEVAANAGLRRMDVAEIVRAVDDPEFFVAGGESRISSSSGRTMSVEKRSLAWTGTMSSWEYFTTGAPCVR